MAASKSRQLTRAKQGATKGGTDRLWLVLGLILGVSSSVAALQRSGSQHVGGKISIAFGEVGSLAKTGIQIAIQLRTTGQQSRK